MAKVLPSINLLKKERKPFAETFLHWALTIGRLIVMVTEVIALSTFLYRFSLDRQVIDLHDKIKQKQTIVSLLKESENKYRNLQNRLILSAQLAAVGPQTISLFTNLISFAPSGLIINTLTASNNAVTIDANAQSLSSVTTFIEKLKTHPKIASVSLNKIENRISTATIGVSISLTTKK